MIEPLVGTFETCCPALRMSVCRGRREAPAYDQKSRNVPFAFGTWSLQLLSELYGSTKMRYAHGALSRGRADGEEARKL
jgi:hypothetical protein